MSRDIVMRETRAGGFGSYVRVLLNNEDIGYVEKSGGYTTAPGLVRIVVDDVETTIDDLRDMIVALTKLAEIAEGMTT